MAQRVGAAFPVVAIDVDAAGLFADVDLEEGTGRTRVVDSLRVSHVDLDNAIVVRGREAFPGLSSAAIYFFYSLWTGFLSPWVCRSWRRGSSSTSVTPAAERFVPELA